MNRLSDSRSTAERWAALVVRYWAFNMNLIHSRGAVWPGFGYSDQEKAELESIAANVEWPEYLAWVTVVAVATVAILAVVVLVGMNLLMSVIGGQQNMAKTPASLFFLALALEALGGLSVGFPAAMLPSAALVGRWFAVGDEKLPDRAVTARYLRKLWFQITRITAIVVAAVLPIWIFLPGDTKLAAILRLVLPLLSPVVSLLTMGYFFSARLKRD